LLSRLRPESRCGIRLCSKLDRNYLATTREPAKTLWNSDGVSKASDEKIQDSLAEGYRQQAAYMEQEAEAGEWCEQFIRDVE
jgi:hypothetical protein